MPRIFLHDEDCQPLGIVSLDWDVDARGRHIRIPVHGPMRAMSYTGREPASAVQAIKMEVMEIDLCPLACKRRDGTTSQGWIGTTREPELCERFFETKF